MTCSQMDRKRDSAGELTKNFINWRDISATQVKSRTKCFREKGSVVLFFFGWLAGLAMMWMPLRIFVYAQILHSVVAAAAQ